MLSLCFKKDPPKEFAIEFMTSCYEGGTHGELEDIFQRAIAADKKDEIRDAKDGFGNLPFQKAAKHGNSTALKWIFETWSKEFWSIDINQLDSDGYTALFHCCVRGYTIGSDETAPKSDDSKQDRLECLKTLLFTNKEKREGIDVNFQNDHVKMTALHWAAYNSDSKCVKLLLENGAKSTLNHDNLTPVDIAAMCFHWDTVKVFM